MVERSFLLVDKSFGSRSVSFPDVGYSVILYPVRDYCKFSAMYIFDTFIRVCYADVDRMGYVYYGNYLKYYEIARNESLRALGLTYREIEEKGVMMPVLKAECRYKMPAYYDENLRIRTILKEIPAGPRMEFFYEVYNRDDRKINEGYTQLAFMRTTDHYPCRCPQFLKDILLPFFEDQER